MSLWQIFRWPLLIGGLTTTGLISGLVSDGWGDALAALGLFVPAALATWFGLRRQQSPRPKATRAEDPSRAEPSAPS